MHLRSTETQTNPGGEAQRPLCRETVSPVRHLKNRFFFIVVSNKTVNPEIFVENKYKNTSYGWITSGEEFKLSRES